MRQVACQLQAHPYGFKPTEVVVHRDGALFVSDWSDGQRPKRGRGSIHRIAGGDKRVSRVNIDALAKRPTSTVSEGPTRSFTSDEFIDVIAFLTSQK